MANTFTKLTGSTANGDYRHEETGFYIHDIRSVADAVKANGVLACDMNSGSWGWVAGEDLYVLVYRRGATTLRALASAILSKKLQIGKAGVNGAMYWNSAKVGSSNSGGLIQPQIVRVARTLGTDLRIFGIATNAQAGRGYSIDMLSTGDVETQKGPFVAKPGIYGWNNNTDPGSGGSVGGSQCVIKPDAAVIGRVVVNVLLSTWEKFLSEWRAALPNIDQGEVQEAADAALVKVRAEALPSMFVRPYVRVPMYLYKDGTVKIDGNPTMCVTATSLSTHGLTHAWNCLLSPTLRESDGWYMTNPFTPGANSHTLWYGEVDGLNMNFFSPGAYGGGGSNNKTFSYSSYQDVASIDGVNLFHILGGLCPRPATGANLTSKDLIGKVAKNSNADMPRPAQEGTMSNEEYNGILTAVANGSTTANTMCAYGHWVLAGQVPMVVGDMLTAAMLGKGYEAVNMFYIGSGTISSVFRRADTTSLMNLIGVDMFANPALMLRHQFA